MRAALLGFDPQLVTLNFVAERNRSRAADSESLAPALEVEVAGGEGGGEAAVFGEGDEGLDDPLGEEGAEEGDDAFAAVFGEAGGGFVDEEEAAVAGDGAGERDAAGFAGAEFRRVGGGKVGAVEEGEEGGGVGLVGGGSEPGADESGEGDVLADGEVAEEAIFLEEDADFGERAAAGGGAVGGDAEDEGFAVAVELAEDRGEEPAFPGAVATEDGEAFSGIDGEVDGGGGGVENDAAEGEGGIGHEVAIRKRRLRTVTPSEATATAFVVSRPTMSREPGAIGAKAWDPAMIARTKAMAAALMTVTR